MYFFFFQAEDGIRDVAVTGVQTCALPILLHRPKDALDTLEPVIETRDPSADTLSLASTAYEDAGDTPKAVSALRQAILLDPRNVSLYLDFANIDRKSTRLNSSHGYISYAVFCLKKKKNIHITRR